jgi:tRNA (Thr-GGU) A37 N-methylase
MTFPEASFTDAIDGTSVRVRNLEALEGTPIVDVKTVLEPMGER